MSPGRAIPPAVGAAAVLDHIRPGTDLIVQSDNGEPVTVYPPEAAVAQPIWPKK